MANSFWFGWTLAPPEKVRRARMALSRMIGKRSYSQLYATFLAAKMQVNGNAP